MYLRYEDIEIRLYNVTDDVFSARFTLKDNLFSIFSFQVEKIVFNTLWLFALLPSRHYHPNNQYWKRHSRVKVLYD